MTSACLASTKFTQPPFHWSEIGCPHTLSADIIFEYPQHVQVDGNCESEEENGRINASLASCLYQYVGRKVGCQMPWVRKPPELQCKTREQYRYKYYVKFCNTSLTT